MWWLLLLFACNGTPVVSPDVNPGLSGIPVPRPVHDLRVVPASDDQQMRVNGLHQQLGRVLVQVTGAPACTSDAIDATAVQQAGDLQVTLVIRPSASRSTGECVPGSKVDIDVQVEASGVLQLTVLNEDAVPMVTGPMAP